MGKTSLDEIVGDTSLLSINGEHLELINELNLDLGFFLNAPAYTKKNAVNTLAEPISELNERLVADLKDAIESDKSISASYEIKNTDRSSMATLFGYLATRQSQARMAEIKGEKTDIKPYSGKIDLTFTGSAGQSFGVFQTKDVDIKLIGEANDSVCKSMSGGKTVIVPNEKVMYKPEDNAIIGNCALYGATGGKLYVHGQAGDRFAVRNSGAIAVVEGTGLHACEYMTNGTVVILGETSDNVGAGMTGGTLFMYENPGYKINRDYIGEAAFTEADYAVLKEILEDYMNETGSKKAAYLVSDWENAKTQFKKFLPLSMIRIGEAENDKKESTDESGSDTN
tara:strand:- start:9 stop:1028 length:1020 start_codon:yes stop_codon:yes gene_type:complete